MLLFNESFKKVSVSSLDRNLKTRVITHKTLLSLLNLDKSKIVSTAVIGLISAAIFVTTMLLNSCLG